MLYVTEIWEKVDVEFNTMRVTVPDAIFLNSKIIKIQLAQYLVSTH